MQHKLKQTNKQSGFTIIEVMIVLAIAGLIMVVVFLAVPALQRSSRNNSMKTDATNLIGAANEYVANKGGVTLTASASGTANSDAALILGSVTTSNITSLTIATEATDTTVPTSTLAIIKTNAKCNSSISTDSTPTAYGALTSAGSSNRQYVITYLTETGSGNRFSCTNG